MKLLATPFVAIPAVSSLLGAGARPLRPLIAVFRATMGRSAMLFTLIGTVLLFIPLFVVPRESLGVIALPVLVAAISAGLTVAVMRSATIAPLLGLVANASLLATVAVAWLVLGMLWAFVLAALSLLAGAAIAGPTPADATVSASAGRIGVSGAPGGARDTSVYFAIGCIGLLILLFAIFVVVSWVTQFTPGG